MLKRTIDITFSILLLLLALPILACLAVLVLLDSGGPVLFRQPRMGRRFKTFELYKLRTMDLHQDGPVYTLGADPRITRSGRWLRRFKLDELPQLWNVLRGDMSMVGPRPVIPALALEFRAAYYDLLAVRPGLTDPASLKYCNEAAILAAVPEPMRYFKTVLTPEKIRISQEYLHVANSFADLSLIFKTALAMFSPARRRPIIAMAPEKANQPVRVLAFPNTRRNRKAQPIFERAPNPALLPIPAALIEAALLPRPTVKPISV